MHTVLTKQTMDDHVESAVGSLGNQGQIEGLKRDVPLLRR
jgi:hypothetical protein